MRCLSANVLKPPRCHLQLALSIVMLPLQHGRNSEQEYFADGVTESLTTEPVGISGSFVMRVTRRSRSRQTVT